MAGKQWTYVSSSPYAKSSMSSSSSDGSSKFNVFISSGSNIKWQVEHDRVPSQAPVMKSLHGHQVFSRMIYFQQPAIQKIQI